MAEANTPAPYTTQDSETAKKRIKKTPLSVELPEKGAPKWTILYGDLMSVVLIFFVLLFSMSTTSKVKYQKSVQSMQKALLSKKQLSSLEKTDIEKLIEIKEQLDKDFQNSEMRSFIKTGFDKKGIRIIIKDSVFFESGDSTLLPTAVPIMNTISTALSEYTYPIIVEGHTDNLPISTEHYASNWELATGRASSVVRFFIDYGNINPNRLVATGYAEFRPLTENSSAINRAKNRRVEIKILEE